MLSYLYGILIKNLLFLYFATKSKAFTGFPKGGAGGGGYLDP